MAVVDHQHFAEVAYHKDHKPKDCMVVADCQHLVEVAYPMDYYTVAQVLDQMVVVEECYFADFLHLPVQQPEYHLYFQFLQEVQRQVIR